jgi:hypothetical protein
MKSIECHYEFEGIRLKKKKEKILNLLRSCKEIRDTAYPLEDSNVTELNITDLYVLKQKDYIYLSGELLLQDGDRNEVRTFVAYLTERSQEYHILLDITRCSEEHPRMIRTTDVIKEDDNHVTTNTTYCSIDYLEEKVFSTELPKDYLDHIPSTMEQLSAL